MNDHTNPVFSGILAAANARPDTTPAGSVPVPRELPAVQQRRCFECGIALKDPRQTFCSYGCQRMYGPL